MKIGKVFEIWDRFFEPLDKFSSPSRRKQQFPTVPRRFAEFLVEYLLQD